MNVMNNSFFYLDYYSEVIEREVQDVRLQIDVSNGNKNKRKSRRELLDLFKKRPILYRKSKAKCIQMDDSDACICA